jgi:hypothetical protein
MDLVFSFVFVMTYIVLETYYWYIFIPMPIIEFFNTGYLIWELFIRSTPRYLKYRSAIFFLSFTQAILFQAFHKQLVKPEYNGYSIGAYFILLKLAFGFTTAYTLWSLIYRKEQIINEYAD